MLRLLNSTTPLPLPYISPSELTKGRRLLALFGFLLRRLSGLISSVLFRQASFSKDRIQKNAEYLDELTYILKSSEKQRR